MLPGIDEVVVVGGSAIVASALLTHIALRYARWQRMFDRPEHRRIHMHSTPRGGGIAIVLTVLAAALYQLRMPLGAAFIAGLLLVAGIGWIDDHRPLSVRTRLLVHFLAALLFVATLWPPQTIDSLRHALLFGCAIVGLVGAINFWNFMDGSDGLVTSQSLWVVSGFALVFAVLGAWPWALCAVALAGACLGFLPFNFPRARVFLGDVGSVGLGFACAAFWLVAFDLQRSGFWELVLLPAVLLIDAGLTLLSRIIGGRRWYTGHREHLYQWLIRAGASHAHVAILYTGWNLLVLLPTIMAMQRWPQHRLWLALAALAFSAAIWLLGKRAVLRRVRNQD